jgi:hypothetical protein
LTIFLAMSNLDQQGKGWKSGINSSRLRKSPKRQERKRQLVVNKLDKFIKPSNSRHQSVVGYNLKHNLVDHAPEGHFPALTGVI